MNYTYAVSIKNSCVISIEHFLFITPLFHAGKTHLMFKVRHSLLSLFFFLSWGEISAGKSTLKDLQETVCIRIRQYLFFMSSWRLIKMFLPRHKMCNPGILRGYFGAHWTQVKTRSNILFKFFFLNLLNLQAAIPKDTHAWSAGNAAFHPQWPSTEEIQ